MRALSLLPLALALMLGCGGVAGAEALVADTPPAPDPFWVCPISKQGTRQDDCGEAVPPLQLSPDPVPSAPSPTTSPGPAALDVPQLIDVDAGVSVLSPSEVARG